ncbi:MAG: DUF1648 domain-containing protein [Gemmatimonadetes bacterium]|nr:DUF1648 domain-containing protein [Gemmatimonadota bacterium]NNF39090.1 DUF1648 domain-containing protein [Gemmatimonadota bacterium]
MRKALDGVNAILLFVVVGYAVWAWPRLPTEIPAHFGIDGRVDRWAATTPFEWFLLPAIAVLSWLGMIAVGKFATARPQRINLPGGQSLADYPESVHPAVREHVRAFVALATTELLVIFGLLVLAQFRTATGSDGQPLILAVLAIAVLSSPIMLSVFFIGVQKAIRTATPGPDRSAPLSGPGARMQRPPRA